MYSENSLQHLFSSIEKSRIEESSAHMMTKQESYGGIISDNKQIK